MIERELAFAAQNHRTQVAAAAQKAREVCRRKTLFAKQVFQHVHARCFRSLNVL